jgi:hypothetical protein
MKVFQRQLSSVLRTLLYSLCRLLCDLKGFQVSDACYISPVRTSHHLPPLFKIILLVRFGLAGIESLIRSAVALSFAFKIALSQVLYVHDFLEWSAVSLVQRLKAKQHNVINPT